MVLEGWHAGFKSGEIVDGKRQAAPPWQVVGTSKLFITFGMIAVGKDPDLIKRNMRRLCGWEQRPRILSLSPYGTKRTNKLDISPIADLSAYNPADRLIPTDPCYNMDYELNGLISKQYKYQWLGSFRELSPEELAYMQEVEEKSEWETQP